MSKFNKVITNVPVPLDETEVENLSQTLSGLLNGGGGEGKIYEGDGVYIDVDNTHITGKITLTQTAKTKLDTPIPTQVSDLTDSANYETTEHANATYLTKSSADTLYAPLSVSGDIEYLSGEFNNYYKKTETSSKKQLSDEFENYQLKSDMEYYATDDELSDLGDSLRGSIAAKQDKLTFGYNSESAISSINGSALAGQGGGTGDYTAGIDLKIENNIISVDTNGNPNNTASNTRNFVEGSWTVASGYNSHAEGMATTAYGYAVHAQGMWTKFSSSKWSDTQHQTPIDIYWAAGAGATVEGYCNATTSCPMSGTEGQSDYGPIHGGILKVIGNGNVVHDQSVDPDAHIHTLQPSDALIIFKDGCISAAGNISANGIELGAGGTTYQGRNGVNVDGSYVELTTTAYESVTSIPSISNDVETLKTASANWNKVSDKLDTTAAAQTYLEKATYASDSATFLTQDDLSDYYKKTDTSSKTELSTEFAKYQPKGNYLEADDITGKLDKSIYANASGKWENASDVVATNSANWNAKVEILPIKKHKNSPPRK